MDGPLGGNGGPQSDVLNRSLGYQLRRAQTRDYAHFMLELADYSLTPGQLGLLLLIESNPGVSQTALARSVGIERSTLGEFIDRFEGRSLVERRSSPTDRRSLNLYLTAGGREFLRSCMPAQEAHERWITGSLTARERATLLRLLSKVAVPFTGTPPTD